MKHVYILLSTYNGEKYLREQLDSLMNQTYPFYTVWIRDDFSIDKTREIIDEYKSMYPEKIKILSSEKNVGYPDCFWTMLQECSGAEYYAFCDQDDVWHKDKIRCAVRMLEKEEMKPLLYVHDYIVSSEMLEQISVHRMCDQSELKAEQLIYFTYAQGFSMVINDEFRKLLLLEMPIGKNLPHDGWCIWNAFFRGKIICDRRLLAKYRRHEDAETSSGMDRISEIRSWIRKEILGNEMRYLEERAAYFLEINNISMKEEDICIWKRLIDRSLINWVRRCFYPKRLRPSLAGEIALRVLFFLGK